MDLLSEAPKEVFYTTPAQFLRQKFPNVVTFEPSTNYYISECRYFGLNWLSLWCISYVTTSNFRDEGSIDFKSYFGLKDAKGKPFKSQTWHDGVRAGVQFVAAHCGKDLSGLPEEKILFPGTKAAMEKPEKVVTFSDLDKVFGSGVGSKVTEVYEAVVKFAKDDGFEVPPSDGDTLPPIKKPPEVEPEKPKPSEPSGPMPAWKKFLISIVSIVSPLLFIIGFFVPGPWMSLIKAVIEFIKHLVGM